MAQSKCLSARLPTFGLRSNGASCNFLQAVGGRFRRSRFTYGPENGHWHSYKTSFLRYLCSCLVFQCTSPCLPPPKTSVHADSNSRCAGESRLRDMLRANLNSKLLYSGRTSRMFRHGNRLTTPRSDTRSWATKSPSQAIWMRRRSLGGQI